MKIIYSSIIPFRGFLAVTIYSLLFIRAEYMNSEYLTPEFYNEEKIHSKQWWEVFLLSFLLLFASFIVFNISAWWILLSIIAYPILYVLSWVIQLILPPYSSAYTDTCFEKEAKENKNNLSYLKGRKPFSFIKYII